MTVTPILPFGTSRSLQALVGLFLSAALATGLALGPVTVPKSSGEPSRRHRLAARAAPLGFLIRILGLEDG
jgi:tagaturonate reductase